MTTTPPESPASADAVAEPAAWPDPPERGRCWFRGCPNEVPQSAGGGRPKVVCEEWVDGLRHTRLNKSLAKRGRIAVPEPGSGGAGPASGAAAEESGERGDKPVTAARQTYGQVLQHVQATLGTLPRPISTETCAALPCRCATRMSRMTW